MALNNTITSYPKLYKNFNVEARIKFINLVSSIPTSDVLTTSIEAIVDFDKYYNTNKLEVDTFISCIKYLMKFAETTEYTGTYYPDISINFMHNNNTMLNVMDLISMANNSKVNQLLERVVWCSKLPCSKIDELLNKSNGQGL